jgi:MoaA/NifB/PqqE/SkfB family radical SAM enzyme
MRKRNKSLGWAANQLVNRSLQGWSYRHDSGLGKPTRIVFSVTLRCNIKCQQCAIWRMPKQEELTTEEWKKTIADLRGWIGPCRLQLVGGETFVRKDMTDIIGFATSQGVLTGVVTNGTMIDRALAERIVASGLGYAHVSLDGVRPETHDEVRGIPGLHVKTMAAIDHLLAAARGSGMSISLATVISRKSMPELVDLVRLVEAKGLDGIIFNPLGPTIDSDPEWHKKTDLWFDDPAQIDRVLDQLVALKRGGAKILNPPEQLEGLKDYFRKPERTLGEQCMVGVTNLGVTCDGFIHTCFKMPPLGNVREIGLRDAWNSAKAREVRGMIKTCNIHCSPGNFVYRQGLVSSAMRFLRYG